MLIVYTGNGKGKTTAAFGLAVRAAGWGRKVAILQFVKEESWPEGARRSFRELAPNLRVEITALGSGFVGIMGDKKPLSEHKKSAAKALRQAVSAVKAKNDLVILDELIGPLHSGLLSEKQIRNLIKEHHKNVGQDLVLTGRHAPDWIIEMADLVTEMVEVKHPFQKGIQAKNGIDF